MAPGSSRKRVYASTTESLGCDDETGLSENGKACNYQLY